MSSYIVDPSVIGNIAHYAKRKCKLQYGCTYGKELEELEAIVRELCNANITGVSARYPDYKDSIVHDFMPDYETNEQWIEDCLKHAKPSRNWDFKQLQDQMSDFEYQSCDDENWYQSKSFLILTQCRDKALKSVLEIYCK